MAGVYKLIHSVKSLVKRNAIKKLYKGVRTALDSCWFSKHLGQYEMKGSIGVTDNNWFAFLFPQPGIDEIYF
jgi:hypothetical protein